MVTRISLGGAIASILGRKSHPDYRELGIRMKTEDLRKLLGLTGTPMLYNYMNGRTNTISSERASIILKEFDLLIDQWLTPEELSLEENSKLHSQDLSREMYKDIVEDLIAIEELQDLLEVKKAVRRIIAKYY